MPRGSLNISLFIISLIAPFADNCGLIKRLYLSVGAPWHHPVASARIKSRIRFRGEGEPIAMDRSVWDLRSFTRFSRRARKIDVSRRHLSPRSLPLSRQRGNLRGKAICGQRRHVSEPRAGSRTVRDN